ncbi:hypothetical protein HG452_003020 [Candidatus Saccharibacteria bacterium]|nr:hypothetical protein [Candidatus Saccharibacteria bacterium]
MKNYENKKNQIQNKEIVKISRKKLKQFGALAMTAGALGGWFGHDTYKNYQENHPPEIFQKSQNEGLDNSEMNFSKLEKISDNGGVIHLQQGDAIRSSTNEYFQTPESYSSEKNNHSSIGVMQKEADFNIQGDVYLQNSDNPKLITRIENFEKTSTGENTKINVNIDKDGWVAVDANRGDFQKNQ